MALNSQGLALKVSSCVSPECSFSESLSYGIPRIQKIISYNFIFRRPSGIFFLIFIQVDLDIRLI